MKIIELHHKQEVGIHIIIRYQFFNSKSTIVFLTYYEIKWNE